MNNNIEIFKNEEFGEIRTVIKNDKVWFVAKDLAKALGYTTLQRMYDHIAKEDSIKINPQKEKYRGLCENGTTIKLENNPNVFTLMLINESGLYDCIFGSQLPNAKQFKRWVTSEVLPTIRQHGAYMTPETIEKTLTDPDFIIKLATNLKEEQEKRRKAEAELEEIKPKALFADSVSASESTILVRDMAKILKQNGFEIGEKRFFEWLRENGYLIKSKSKDYNSPTQKAMDLKLFKIKETAINTSSGVKIKKTSLITGKGQNYFVNKFLGGKK